MSVESVICSLTATADSKSITTVSLDTGEATLLFSSGEDVFVSGALDQEQKPQDLPDEEKVPEDLRPGAVLHEPELHHIKEEQEEVCTSLGGEQLSLKEEIDAINFPRTPLFIKNEEDQQSAALPQLYQDHVKVIKLPVENDGGEECMRIKDPEDGSISLKTDEDSDVKLSYSETKPLLASALKTNDKDNSLEKQPAPDSNGNTVNKPSGPSEFGEQFVQSCCLQKDMKHFALGPLSSLDDTKCFTKQKNIDLQRNDQKESLKKLSCEDCGKTFTGKQGLNRHMTIHTGDKHLCCNFCGQRFSEQSCLNTHMRTHSGEKPFCCDLCGHRFSWQVNLNKHLRTHTGQQPFCCDLCGQRFSLKGNLNRHMRIHTGQKPFCCDLCGKKFRHKESLNTHTRTHTGQKPFCCDQCRQRFSLKGNLNAHMRIHTGQKPFCCDKCGHRFSQKESLNRHLRIHTGQKPFTCDHCGQKFTHKESLKRHMKIHKGGT